MKLSELVQLLEEAKNRFGDIEVGFGDFETYDKAVAVEYVDWDAIRIKGETYNG
jgi:hypothetical protein